MKHSKTLIQFHDPETESIYHLSLDDNNGIDLSEYSFANGSLLERNTLYLTKTEASGLLDALTKLLKSKKGGS